MFSYVWQRFALNLSYMYWSLIGLFYLWTVFPPIGHSARSLWEVELWDSVFQRYCCITFMVAYLCVLALLFSFVVFLFFRQMYICHNIHLCLLMAKSMFSADFANKLWTLIYLNLVNVISCVLVFLKNCNT